MPPVSYTHLDENGFFSWLLNFLFGWLGKSDTEPVYSGWRTAGGKTYYYSQTTNKPVTGIQCIDNKLYYFNADGVLENGKTFGVDEMCIRDSGSAGP